jgi:hypothetical protein
MPSEWRDQIVATLCIVPLIWVAFFGAYAGSYSKSKPDTPRIEPNEQSNGPAERQRNTGREQRECQ